MDDFVKTIITTAPNLMLAVWFILRQQKTIDSLLENQTKLIDRLLGYVDKDKQAVQRVLTQSADGAH